MNPSKHKNERPQPRSKKKSSKFPAVVILVFITLLAGGSFFYYKVSSRFTTSGEETSAPFSTADKTPAEIKKGADTDKQKDVSGKGGDLSDSLQQSTEQGQISPTDSAAPTLAEDDQAGLPEPASTAETDISRDVPNCEQPTAQISSFYNHLDEQPYMIQYGLPTSSRNHFNELIQKLLANPPQVARESDDLYAILKNTAHFFRVCGKDNIIMLKGILDNEKDSLEEILADYYHLVSTPDCIQTPYAGNINSAALYEYACFFLNTMGGRLYLFRRDSLSRMVVTYYAIMLVDQANEENNNHHGINLKPAVDMLISEMEASGGALKRGDFYLDNLYGLKEKYQDQ